MTLRAKPILGAAALLLLLTWLALRSTNMAAHNVQQTLNILDEVAAAESALHRDLLGARTGILNNYDPIVAEVRTIRDSIPRLQAKAPADPAIAAEIEHFQKLAELQENETERFKSRNALLRNSQAYFQLFSARLSAESPDPALVSRVGKLTAAMLHLTIDSAPAAIGETDAALQDFPTDRFPAADAETAKALLSHARLLRDLLPATDAGLKTLFALPSHQQRETIRRLVVARGAAAERTASLYRSALYAVSLLLGAGLLMLGLRLERRARHMRRRADIEHVIAGVSTRFINARSELVPVQIEHALEQLSRCVGADRAYFIAGEGAAHAYLWRAPGVACPADWPRSTVTATTAVRGQPGGMIRVRRSHLPEPGHVPGVSCANDWFCIGGGEASDGLLGFESLAGELKLADGDAGLWHMAFDAIAHAVERELLEDDRRRLETKLQQARRMETIGTLASGIAHNFNNIVGAILGYAEMALADVDAASRPGESLGEIRRAGERARDLIDQILSFGRRGDAERRRVRLDALIAAARALLVATLPSTVRFEVIRGAEEAVGLQGIPGQLQQVLVNICNNAIQAVDDHGVIRIETRIVVCPAPLPRSHGRLAAGRYAVISIRDNGRGMDAATREQIFEPFFTTRAEGNGLGLATALEIVRDHGGDIEVDSAVGEGTRFDIWLPCDARPDAEPAGPRDAIRRGNGETVLLYNAEARVLMRQEEILAALGYEPAGYATIGAMLEAYRATPRDFDIAVICCPPADPLPLESVEALHRIAPTLPIVLAVTSSAGLAAFGLAAAGVTEIIGLPLVSGELADALARCSRRAALMAPRPAVERRNPEAVSS